MATLAGFLLAALIISVFVNLILGTEMSFHKSMSKFYKERYDYWFEAYLGTNKSLRADVTSWWDRSRQAVADEIEKQTFEALAETASESVTFEHKTMDELLAPMTEKDYAEAFRLTLNAYIGDRPLAEVSREVGATKEYVRNILSGKSRPSREKAWALMWETGFSEEDRNYYAENFLPTLRGEPTARRSIH